MMQCIENAGERRKKVGLVVARLLAGGLMVSVFAVAPAMHWTDDGMSLSNSAIAKGAGRDRSGGDTMASGRTGGRGSQVGRGDVRSLGGRGLEDLSDRGTRQGNSYAGVDRATGTVGSEDQREWIGNGSSASLSSGQSGTMLTRSMKIDGANVFKPRSGAKVNTVQNGLKGISGLREVSNNEERGLIGKWGSQ